MNPELDLNELARRIQEQGHLHTGILVCMLIIAAGILFTVLRTGLQTVKMAVPWPPFMSI